MVIHSHCMYVTFVCFYYVFLDIDECATAVHNCHANATCANTDGIYTCTCNAGYIGDGVTCHGKVMCFVAQNWWTLTFKVLDDFLFSCVKIDKDK